VRVVINPKTLTETGEDTGTPNEKLEGCLSVPGVLGLVTRRHDVDFVYWDESGKRHRESLSGREARIYQHEKDHLLGVLFVDKAKAFYPVGHHFAETHQKVSAAGRD
jgi:peptide deformylase